MINSVCSNMGSLKSENSFTKLPPTSSNESVSESKKNPLSSGTEENSLTRTSLSFPSALKFEVVGDVEIQSPDNSLWEPCFADKLEGDFMICSPVRNISSSSETSNFNYNFNSAKAMHVKSLVGCSPPRMSSPLGPCSHKGKGNGLSPLHKVFTSPNNQYMHIESLSLPSLESLLDDNYAKEDDLLSYATIKSLDLGTYSSKLSESVGETSIQGSSQVTTEDDTNQMGTNALAPLSQQLQRERQQEKQQQAGNLQQQSPLEQAQQLQPQNMNQGLILPLKIGPEQEQDSGLQLVHFLLACAEAVAKEDYMLARRYLNHLNRVVTPLGDSMQRIAACFTDALSARLAATLTRKPTISAPKPLNPFPPNSLEMLKIYQILYQACPYAKFAHFTANQALFEAFEAEERVHVIDLDILQGYQWPAFMQALAARPGGAPFLRITGVCSCMESLRETGRCLTELAHSLHVPFEFHPVAEQLEYLKPHMFNRRIGEALAVNSINRLHRVPSNCLGTLLAMIRDQEPNIVSIVEQEASYNGPYFLGRFLEALHYYSAIFDSLDATFPADSAQRAKVEQYIFAPEIRNIVECEGPERVMRHERLEKWRKLMEGNGFKSVPLSANAVTQANILLSMYSCDGYRLTEDEGCLLLGWQDRSILAASAWRC